MRELEALIRDIDREIERAFEQTFEATAKNFEEMVEHLFPGGRGRLRRVSLRPVRDAEEASEDGGRGRRGGRGGGRRARGARGRDRGHPGRQVDPQALAALRRREVAGRDRLRLRRLPRPALPLLHPRRGRGRPRRRQHRPLPAADPALLRPRPVRHRHPPETDDGRRRRPLRGQHGRRRRHQGRLPPPAARSGGRRAEEAEVDDVASRPPPFAGVAEEEPTRGRLGRPRGLGRRAAAPPRGRAAAALRRSRVGRPAPAALKETERSRIAGPRYAVRGEGKEGPWRSVTWTG